jgi:hypothetical protein
MNGYWNFITVARCLTMPPMVSSPCRGTRRRWEHGKVPKTVDAIAWLKTPLWVDRALAGRPIGSRSSRDGSG